ncbi:unnamed protein product [Ranitomeya imitator]|uniref:Uncharacterized protein n=1 Tax=Ranitomeya imitator TaxID=111125 RepID=A0ABN9LVE5_9NEOB|nr:unnamed protein product [Ranitomeya imitator]
MIIIPIVINQDLQVHQALQAMLDQGVNLDLLAVLDSQEHLVFKDHLEKEAYQEKREREATLELDHKDPEGLLDLQDHQVTLGQDHQDLKALQGHQGLLVVQPESGPVEPDNQPYVVPMPQERSDDEDYDHHEYAEHMRWRRSLRKNVEKS